MLLFWLVSICPPLSNFPHQPADIPVASAVLAVPSPLTPDPNGDHLIGNGQGQQFITGGCLSTADCSQAVVPACCAFIAGGAATGICSGNAVGNVNGKAGCGFGDSGSSTPAASSTPAVASTASTNAGPAPAQCAVDTSLPGSQSVGLGTAVQFITGQCFTPADCASGCCVAQASGISLCKARIVTEEAGLTCYASCTGGAPASAASVSAATSSAAAVAGAAGSAQCTVNTALAGSQSVGLGMAAQFITGQCFSKADCASGCCVAQASGVSLCKAQLVTQQAGLSCDFTCA